MLNPFVLDSIFQSEKSKQVTFIRREQILELFSKVVKTCHDEFQANRRTLLLWTQEVTFVQKEQQIFKLHAPYQPTGDQPQAIEELVRGFKEGNQFETLHGVTGSGKTFTMANVIAQLNKPTLIISHNKTLAAQLYGEFKEFFPENAVEYFVS